VQHFLTIGIHTERSLVDVGWSLSLVLRQKRRYADFLNVASVILPNDVTQQMKLQHHHDENLKTVIGRRESPEPEFFLLVMTPAQGNSLITPPAEKKTSYDPRPREFSYYSARRKADLTSL
jgi:hypothetical protein